MSWLASDRRLIIRRFKLQNHLTEVTPKVKKIEDYEMRIKQFTEMLRKWYVSTRN